jgi:DNA-binding protein H-NS
MSSYAELLKQREELEKQIESARQNEIKNALVTVRQLVDQFNLSVADVFPVGKSKSSKSGNKVAAKYRDPVTGATWTGRGKAPKWIDGKDRKTFAL